MFLISPRNIICLTIVGCSLVWIAGCTRPPGSRTEILYSFWGSLEQQKIERQIVADFEKENPDIHVRMLPIGARYGEKIQAMMVGGVAPDVISTNLAYDEWASRGVLMDVTDVVNDLDQELRLMPVPRQTFERDGRFYAAPVNAHGFVLYCNLDALAKAGIPFAAQGWTWKQIEEMAPKLSRRNGDPESPTDYVLTLPPVEVMLASFGARLFDDRNHPTRVIADGPEIRRTLACYRFFMNNGYAVPPDVSADQGSTSLFRDGKIAFFISGRWASPEFVGRTKFDWDVVPVPTGGPNASTWHGNTGLAIWQGTKQVEAAKRFLRFYAGRQGALTAMRGGRTIPVYESIAYGPEFLAMTPPASMARFSDTMKEGAAASSLYAPGYSQIQLLLNGAHDQVVYRQAPIDQVVKELTEDLDRWLSKRKSRNAATASTP